MERRPITNIFGYIYLTTNIKNGHQYLGKHKWNKPRIDKSYYGSGNKIVAAIKSYGKQCFKVEILDWANSLDELNQLEINYIKLFANAGFPLYYNIAPGGDGGDYVSLLSEEERNEWKRKLSIALTGHIPYNKGIPMDENRLKQHIESMRKLSKNPEWVEKNKAHMLSWNSSEKSQQDRIKLANSRKMCVIQFSMNSSIIDIHLSGADAGRSTGLSKGNISKCCRGEIPSAYGYKWMYLKDYVKTIKRIPITKQEVDYGK